MNQSIILQSWSLFHSFYFTQLEDNYSFQFVAFFMKSLVVGVREQGKALWKKDGGFFIGNTCTQIAKFFHKIQHSCTIATLESVQDFLIKFDMKPCMHLVEISIFSLNLVIIRLTKIMNTANKNCALFLEIQVS